MGSEADARTDPVGAGVTGFDRGAAVTRALLGWGVVVGPFYLALGVGQGLVRDGFDFGRHPLSVLANGPGGWLQTASFALSGLMVVAAAVGFARVLRPWSPSAAWILGLYGVAVLAAAIFPADPVDGFPPGTPEGFPTTISTPGLLHFVFGATGFLALAVSCVVVGLALRRRGDRALAALSMVAGAIVAGGFFGPMVLRAPGGIAGIWVAVVVGWGWLAATSAHLYRIAPDPGC